MGSFDIFAGDNSGVGVAGIIESAATATEFCGCGLDFEAFANWVSAKVEPSLLVYRTMLASDRRDQNAQS